MATVARQIPLAPAHVAYRRVLVPVQGGRGWSSAVATACSLTVDHEGTVSVLVVIEVPSALPLDAHMPEEEAEARDILAAAEAIGDEREILDAPYRDLGRPFLSYLRRTTADPGAVVNVVMPELVVRRTDRLLHNQRALYLKRLLLFEPRVILTSVPYQLLQSTRLATKHDAAGSARRRVVIANRAL